MTTTAVAKPRVRVGTDGRVRPAGAPERPVASASYMRGDYPYGGGVPSSFLMSWTPALRDGRNDVLQGYTRSAARVIDAVHNSGWLAGMVRQAIASTIGTGLSLVAKPDVKLFGGDIKAANSWAQEVEAAFDDHATCPEEVDAAGKHTLGQMTEAALRSHFAYGEILGLLPMIDRPGSETRLKLKLLPPHKLVQDTDGVRLFQGVHHDAWDYPLAYRMMLRLNASNMETPVDVPARDGLSRKQVLHIFNGEVGTVRGISEFAPSLQLVRQFDQLADATLTTSLLQTIFSATLESSAPTMEALQGLQNPGEQGVSGGSIEDFLEAKLAFHKGTRIDLGQHGKIAHLFPGESLKFNSTQTPHDNYQPFAKLLLREISRCAGMTFEEATGDYAGATYASINMASAVVWPITLTRRIFVAVPLVQPVYEAWLEERIESGRQGFPGGIVAFRANRRAACRAYWRGPPKPQGDWLKMAKAYETLRNMGVITDEQICAELGSDWQDVMEQRARERAERERLGLPETDAASVAKDNLGDQLLAEPDAPAKD